MTRLNYNLTGKRVYVAGHGGMVGAAILRRLKRENCEIVTRTRQETDLRSQSQVSRWMKKEKPDVVIIAAGKSGGILANRDLPGSFLYENLIIATNIIHAAFEAGVQKLLYLAAPHVYPAETILPTPEHMLLTGSLDPEYENASIARITAIKLCQAYHRQYKCDFVAAIPAEIYGPGDNFDPRSSRVIPALIRKTHEAKQTGADRIQVWGHGTATREFLYVDDCADAIITIIKYCPGNSNINISAGGSAAAIAIMYLAGLICDIVGFGGKIDYLRNLPTGVAERSLQGSRLRQLGWQPEHNLYDGLVKTYEAFQNGTYRENDMKLVG